ncbi:hypothetical protein DPM13_14965 [Paracoccus mutanolyticus]|uniref:(2Fe-2S)-binding protein n=1 Tax=Paracoccus mutanolyticus TaxID=1499308 RepID=A0ABM6WT68_9RHOB|nr:hypothetical protein DPM13_14965 [Paracoccus mutanolyticus]
MQIAPRCGTGWADVSRFRSHSQVIARWTRAPLCMMGCCFECLVTVDGQAPARHCRVSENSS